MRQPVTLLTQTAHNWGITLIRIAIGVVFIAHGYQKVFGWGIGGVANTFQGMGIPLPLISAILASFTELLGGIALVLGFGTRLASIPMAFTMLVAFATAHAKNGFFMQSNGFEYVFTLFFALVALFFLGSGPVSLDSIVAEKFGEADSK